MRKSDSCDRGMVSKGNKGARGLRLWFQRNMPINFAQSLTAELPPCYASAGRADVSGMVPRDISQANLQAKVFGMRIRRRKQRCNRGLRSRERRNLMRVPLRAAYLLFRAKMNGPVFLRRFGAQNWPDAREIAAPRARAVTSFVNSTLVASQAAKKTVSTRIRRSSNWSQEWWEFLATERKVYHDFAFRHDGNMFRTNSGLVSYVNVHPIEKQVECCTGTGVFWPKCIFWHRRHFIDYLTLKEKMESD
jgi:hypothetical protein